MRRKFISLAHLVGVCVRELVLEHGRAGVDEPGVGDDPELLHLGREEDGGGRQEQGVHAAEGVLRVEPLEEHRGRGDHLNLTQK